MTRCQVSYVVLGGSELSQHPEVGEVFQAWPLGRSHPVKSDDLVDLYRWPDNKVTVRANMVSSIDGAAQGPDGLSGSLNNAADKLVFDALRALCDVVLVAAGTVRDEGYESIEVPETWREQRQRLGLASDIVFAVVTASGHVPDVVLSGGDTGRVPLVFTTLVGRESLRGKLVEDNIVVVGQEQVEPSRVISALAQLGLVRILTEGGPSFLSQLLRAGLVDELCLTTVGALSPGSHRTVTDDGQERNVLMHCTLAHQLVCPDPVTTLALWRLNPERRP